MTEIATAHPATDNEFYQARDRVLTLATHQLLAFLPLLDRPLMHERDVASVLLKAIQGNRNFRARILYSDAKDALERRHELLDVARRLPSYFELRRVPPEHRDRTDCLLIADRKVLLSRPDERYLQDGLLHAEPGRLNRAIEQFDELWQQSTQETNTRLLLL